MPSRRRRRSRPRTSRRSGSLSYLLVLVLVVGIGYLLVQRGVLPAPPSPTRPAPEADGAGDNSAAIRRLGGTVQYGQVNPITGQRSGVRATITPAMVAAAARDELGSPADPDIRPPGLDQLPARNRARAHLLGRQLGGSGDLTANLVALYQTRTNTPVMRDYETAVAEAVRAGEVVRYSVHPRYPSATFKGRRARSASPPSATAAFGWMSPSPTAPRPRLPRPPARPPAPSSGGPDMLERLRELLPPPADPVEPGRPDGWGEVEGALGTGLPGDFKAFTEL